MAKLDRVTKKTLVGVRGPTTSAAAEANLTLPAHLVHAFGDAAALLRYSDVALFEAMLTAYVEAHAGLTLLYAEEEEAPPPRYMAASPPAARGYVAAAPPPPGVLLDDLTLSLRLQNALASAGMTTISDVYARRPGAVSGLGSMTDKIWRELLAALAKTGVEPTEPWTTLIREHLSLPERVPRKRKK